jgi:hypothetical protein
VYQSSLIQCGFFCSTYVPEFHDPDSNTRHIIEGSVREAAYMAYSLVTQEHTLIVIVSGELVAGKLAFVSRAEAESR